MAFERVRDELDFDYEPMREIGSEQSEVRSKDHIVETKTACEGHASVVGKETSKRAYNLSGELSLTRRVWVSQMKKVLCDAFPNDDPSHA
jgi:hypothetical protein